MKQADVVLGETYIVKVSGFLVPVVLESVSTYGGWNGRNTRTGREVRIRTAAKLRRRVGHPTALAPPSPPVAHVDCKSGNCPGCADARRRVLGDG
jgi:allophanate hydrolase subunit 2